uniref:LCCL domain-containing protein n=1 Tax=Ciona savignyi TaxID=51511 RepID=H2YEZ7_CIOSA
YALESSLCGAAVHHGILHDHFGGEVTLRKVTWSNHYVGSRRNGVTSLDSNSYSRSFVLEVIKILAVSCTTKASDILDNTFTVICPENCLRTNPLDGVVGTRIYADSSEICKAAIHFGSITEAGGVVTVRKMGKTSYFTGTEMNGIQSESMDGKPHISFVFG